MCDGVMHGNFVFLFVFDGFLLFIFLFVRTHFHPFNKLMQVKQILLQKNKKIFFFFYGRRIGENVGQNAESGLIKK